MSSTRARAFGVPNFAHDLAPPPDLRIGHVHLRVSDLDRSIAFYRDALGLTLNVYGPAIGLPAAFLAAGNYHHHIALNTFESLGTGPAPRGHPGLDHLALLYPDREALRRAVRRLVRHGVALVSGSDHGGSVAVYVRDPDGNGIELSYDRPRTQWVDPDGRWIVKNERFDPMELLDEAEAA